MKWKLKLIKRKNKEGVATSYSITLPIIIIRELGLEEAEGLEVEWKEGDKKITIVKE